MMKYQEWSSFCYENVNFVLGLSEKYSKQQKLKLESSNKNKTKSWLTMTLSLGKSVSNSGDENNLFTRDIFSIPM